MTLYRYFNFADGLSTLENSLLKVGRFYEFNDPFEFFPQNCNFGRSKCLVRGANLDLFRGMMNDHYGILCFSFQTTVNKPILWSHYADCHRGMAIGFDIKVGRSGAYILDGTEEEIRNGLGVSPVIYDGYRGESARYSIDNDTGLARFLSDVEDGGTNLRVPVPRLDQLVEDFDESEFGAIVESIDSLIKESKRPLLYHKGIDWSYEAEWRAVVGLKFCKFQGGKHFIPLDGIKISKIVLGMKCMQNPSFLKEFADRFGAGVYQATPSTDTFSLKVELVD